MSRAAPTIHRAPAPWRAPALSLLDILRQCRSYGTGTEERFAASLPGRADECGNRILDVGHAPTILFSAHTDTVSRAPRGGIQHVRRRRGTAAVLETNGTDVLGADDGAGIWILLGMIRAGVPGRYIFHRGEERGGIGSRHIAAHTPEILAPIRAAVAFDRRGTCDVISHMVTGRTCSDTFAAALAAALAGDYAPCDHGTYTDTAEYAHAVSECTNVSIGYECEHSPWESLDVDHCVYVAQRACRIDWRGLPIARDPHAIDPDDAWGWYRSSDYRAPLRPAMRYTRYVRQSQPQAVQHLCADCGWIATDSLADRELVEYGVCGTPYCRGQILAMPLPRGRRHR